MLPGFFKSLLFTALLSISFVCLYANEKIKQWSFELHGGVVYNYPLPLIFEQKGYPDIRINKAIYRSEPLNDPYYWDWRFSRWKNNRSVEFEAIHHKIYLANKPADVQRFGISHGFNILTVNRGWRNRICIFRAGLGSVLVHPESTVRNLEYPVGPGFDFPGYRLRGIVLNIAAARRLEFGKYFFVNAECKITGSMVNADIVQGKAKVHLATFHFILGPGINWNVRPMLASVKDK